MSFRKNSPLNPLSCKERGGKKVRSVFYEMYFFEMLCSKHDKVRKNANERIYRFFQLPSLCKRGAGGELMSIKQTVRELRKNQTEAEAVLWEQLRNRRLSGKKFVRQYPFPFEYFDKKRFFVADFYCHEHRLIVELDGNAHIGRELYDTMRTNLLEILKLNVIRFSNEEVFRNLPVVLNKISSHFNSPLGLFS
jgi:very-short-patch-repair endonuclease